MYINENQAVPYDDLAFWFQVSSSTISSILVTWIKLMSMEVAVLIIWPTHTQIKQHLPNCFKRLYSKVRHIIDCFECFTQKTQYTGFGSNNVE